MQVIIVAIANPITHSKVKIRVIFVLKIRHPRTQKARGNDLLSMQNSSTFPEGRTYTKLNTVAQALHENSKKKTEIL